MYSVTILGNVEQCRTEAEISNSEGTVLAVVYEASDGRHTDILGERLNQAVLINAQTVQMGTGRNLSGNPHLSST